MSAMIDVVVPARNEEETVGDVVATLVGTRLFSRVLVVDSLSSDATAAAASAAGAEVVRCDTPGLGAAMLAGIAKAEADLIFRTDADIRSWKSEWAEQLVEAHCGGLTRAIFGSDYDEFPVNRLVGSPLLELAFGSGSGVPLPLSGTYLFDRSFVDLSTMPADWAFDIAIVCAALEAKVPVSNVDIGVLNDRPRPLDHYVPMAKEILSFMIERYLSGKLV